MSFDIENWAWVNKVFSVTYLSIYKAHAKNNLNIQESGKWIRVINVSLF